MPWIMMPDGEKRYIVSKYAKEELPTWSEIYHDYYQNKSDYFDPLKDTDLDPYWQLPRKKVLLATIANQFNKMLYEDHYKEKVIEDLNRRFAAEDGEITDIKFLIEPYDGYTDEWIQFIRDKFVGLNCPPPIYNIPHPKGWKNPFIVVEYDRVDISKLDGELMLYPIVTYKYGQDEYGIDEFYPTDVEPKSIYMRKEIMSIMIQQYHDYFENVTGWKDHDGVLITSSKQTYHQMSDPAL